MRQEFKMFMFFSTTTTATTTNFVAIVVGNVVISPFPLGKMTAPLHLLIYHMWIDPPAKRCVHISEISENTMAKTMYSPLAATACFVHFDLALCTQTENGR